MAWHDAPHCASRDADAPERQARKHVETLLLADRIPVAASRGHGLRGHHADVAIPLRAAPSPAAAYVCVYSLLSALPEAVVQVPVEFARLFVPHQRVSTAHPL